MQKLIQKLIQDSEIRNQFIIRIHNAEWEFKLFVFDQIVYSFGGEVGLKTSCEDVTE